MIGFFATMPPETLPTLIKLSFGDYEVGHRGEKNRAPELVKRKY